MNKRDRIIKKLQSGLCDIEPCLHETMHEHILCTKHYKLWCSYVDLHTTYRDNLCYYDFKKREQGE